MKNNMRKIIFAVFACLFALLQPVTAQNKDKYEEWGPLNGKDWGCLLRTGYILGGTTPMPLPAEIRSIGQYRPQGGFTVHFDAYKMFNKRYGVMAGVHYFMEGMFTGAEVKNYAMGIQMGEDYLEGRFTGTDETESFMAGFTIPVMATFRLSPRWNMNVGPYASFLIYRLFEGSVYDGYLRVGDPTGEKVEISKENPATYDFSDDMRRVLWGMEIGFDWKATKRLTTFASLDWGMNSIFKRNFETVAFPMYPFYATFGIAYLLF